MIHEFGPYAVETRATPRTSVDIRKDYASKRKDQLEKLERKLSKLKKKQARTEAAILNIIKDVEMMTGVKLGG